MSQLISVPKHINKLKHNSNIFSSTLKTVAATIKKKKRIERKVLQYYPRYQ